MTWQGAHPGCKRRDHIRIEDLLRSAKIPSLNEITVMAVAVETWKCFHSNDGDVVPETPLAISSSQPQRDRRGLRLRWRVH
ncbi:Hypothetical protein FKW44_012387 [Caligus rogercresseyi]|uniref:Uncharacterized protein n=1 Tax=Caligus rogercresseyi TaxID=217165 RepID=A0A7T8HJE8_CALRO|nr:Hypothetical protein FKW44_012387 [Caligus rogercresseyi]